MLEQEQAGQDVVTLECTRLRLNYDVFDTHIESLVVEEDIEEVAVLLELVLVVL